MDFWVYFKPVTNDQYVLGSVPNEELAASLAQNIPEAIYFQAELTIPTSRYNRIRELVEKGILGPELCPEPHYWHWPILNYGKLPVEFLVDAELYGEIRYY